MNEDIEEVEALLKPTRTKRRIILVIMIIALALLIAMGVLLTFQIDYLDKTGINHIKWIPIITKSVIFFRFIAIILASLAMKTNTLSFWNLISSCIFISYFLSCAINVFVIVVCPDLSKRVWSVLIIISELFLNIISVICSMIQTYQTIVTTNSTVSLDLADPQKELIVFLLKAILNVVPGVNIFSEQLIKAVKME